ncbi:ABC transporter [Salmonella enterica subsp. arizonae]|uniref:ABC transporter n=1 Tax=Salmonella enterica subsp. arizonae TaxID=59203 RepID=A0A379TBY9_SALER|nr:ABC transporter [Salmonella enterica subsp. arizonae]
MKSLFSHFLRLITLLVLVAAGTFILLSFSPVDPIRAYIGNDLLHVPPEQYARIAARWGLDQPLWERFGHWFWRLLQGDMGYSMLFNAPVASVIRERFCNVIRAAGRRLAIVWFPGRGIGFSGRTFSQPLAG